MSQPAFLDFEALLAPISESRPCGTSFESGEDPILSQLFPELRSLTQYARRIEAKRFQLASMGPEDRRRFLIDSQGSSDGPQADAKWGRIAEIAIEILIKHSKDTRVMVSLIEAMARLHGLPGMRDAFKATAMLLGRYKLATFPMPDQGDVAFACVESIARICESETNNLKSAIFQADIFEEQPGYSWFAYIAATNHEKLSAEERNEYIQAGDFTLENFQSAINSLQSSEKINAFDEKITEAIAEAKNLDEIMTVLSDRRIGIQNIIDDLTKLQRWYRALIEDRLKEISAIEQSKRADDETAQSESNASTSDGSKSVSGAISSRQQALNSLLQIAAYFRKTEPHSPLSYSLEQAVRWGQMPLPDLLRDLVADRGTLEEVFKLMGIQEKQDDSGS